MAPKKEMTQAQKILLASKGYNPGNYEVLFDAIDSMIIRSLDKTDFALIPKARTGGLFLSYGKTIKQ